MPDQIRASWLFPLGPESVTPRELDAAIVRAYRERRYLTLASLAYHAEVTLPRARRALRSAGIDIDTEAPRRDSRSPARRAPGSRSIGPNTLIRGGAAGG